MKEKYTKKRRASRVKVGSKVEGKVRTINNASLIEFSTTGAMIEHAHLLRPGILCDLNMRWGEKECSVRAKVVWSVVVRSEKDEKNQEILIYRSGLEFYGLRKGQMDFIGGIVGSFLLGGILLGNLKVRPEILQAG